jgi:Phosphate-selective porin O and P
VLRRFLSCCAGWLLAAVLLLPAAAQAQVTPAAGYTPPDDTPAVKVGGVLFLDFTQTQDPKITDVDGNRVSPSAFNVGRAYLNVTGQLNHLFAFRITPDVVRETGTGSSVAGSLTYRLKYGYGQFNLDDWLWRGSYVRFGMIQTPYTDFEETVYRYRFQGTIFADREGFASSADYGVSFRTAFPQNYGEVIAGFYNGDTYTRADPNDQKSFRLRATVRPFPGPGLPRGLRVTAYVDRDHTVKDADRNRFIASALYEHKYANAYLSYLKATDQTSVKVAAVDGDGFSFWVTPKTTFGLEGLFRFDRLNPNDANNSKKERVIGGVAYWPKMTVTTVNTCILLDVEQVKYTDFAPARPTEKRIAVHMLITF